MAEKELLTEEELENIAGGREFVIWKGVYPGQTQTEYLIYMIDMSKQNVRNPNGSIDMSKVQYKPHGHFKISEKAAKIKAFADRGHTFINPDGTPFK